MLSCLQLLVDHQRLESFLELVDGHFFTVPLLKATVDGFRWDQHVAHDVNNAIRCNAILNGDSRETVDLDADEASVATYVN